MNEEALVFIHFLKTQKKMTDANICEIFKISSRMTIHRWRTGECEVTLSRYVDLCKIMEDYMNKPAKHIFMTGMHNVSDKLFGYSEHGIV